MDRDVADLPLGGAVVSSLVTSISRRIGRAMCHSWPRAAWARARVERLSSQWTWSQYGSRTIAMMRSFWQP